MCVHRDNIDIGIDGTSRYVLLPKIFGGKYDLIQLHRQIIHQNDGISMRTSLRPSPPAFSIQNLKKTEK